MELPAELSTIVQQHPHPLIFATVSGAHLYGFESPDSDWDLRGCHVLPARVVVRLAAPDKAETYEVMGDTEGLDLDLVTHDIRKFMLLLLNRNGYVLEQLLSPLVVHTTPIHGRLVELSPQLVTRNHAHHYKGFLANQVKVFGKEATVKALLYCFRVALTGIHLLETGSLEANLATLTDLGLARDFPYVGELIVAKRSGGEHAVLSGIVSGETIAEDLLRLEERLLAAAEASTLQETPTCRDELDDLLVEVRLGKSPPVS